MALLYLSSACHWDLKVLDATESLGTSPARWSSTSPEFIVIAQFPEANDMKEAMDLPFIV